ncbi:MAG: PorP/SprF family type IX secretion system membrane protein [Bacteroidales bacterium]|jgi:type IX secretion system PorP/SprF family membrane protein|nr:PorP/SprF family type IX secretion system membrane protein [Bacteroidales bacterium]MCK9498843.1 PorP/SprF family type IX secretion system membrane protein [Bacteroidales bacterium]MDY0314995.1 PorP/SprF family type IX secretion system membrane protein [Bacteroidales bacterium]
MKTKIIIILTVLSLISFKNYAQQLEHHRNYVYNIAIHNPSAISLSEIPEIILNHRSQWIGFSGAPRISSIYGKYLFRQDMGASASMLYDKLGLNQKLSFNLAYSYIIPTDNFNLSFGLAWTFNQIKILSTEMVVHDINDQILNLDSNQQIWKPDANIGMMFNAKNFFAGFSIVQLFKSKYKFQHNLNDVSALIQDARHLFITGAYHFRFEENQHSISPILNLYSTKGSPFKFDIMANYTYKSTFSTGLALSKGDALIFSLGYKYDRFTISYAFDFVISRIRNVSSGAHEITFGVYLFDKKASGFSNPMF